MSDFEPTTDFPESVDASDEAIESSAKLRDEKVQRSRRNLLRLITLAAAIGLVAAGYTWWRVIVAVLAGYVLLSIGMAMMGALARPIPEPPPPGELRRVKLTYRCPSCGAELRMTLANDQVPTPPRHCADEMDLTTKYEDML